MLTAQEAREKIDPLATRRGAEEKKKVEEKVTEAVENGERYCSVGIYVSNATVAWLEGLGYKVERFSDQREGNDTKISW